MIIYWRLSINVGSCLIESGAYEDVNKRRVILVLSLVAYVLSHPKKREKTKKKTKTKS